MQAQACKSFLVRVFLLLSNLFLFGNDESAAIRFLLLLYKKFTIKQTSPYVQVEAELSHWDL